MRKSWKRQKLEDRLLKLGWELKPQWWITNGSVRLGLASLDGVEKAADWLESLNLETPSQRFVPSSIPEVSHVCLLSSVAESAIDALRTAGAELELKALLGYLKQAVKGVDPNWR